ncbi:MAG: FprA family A-type flavoprotein [Deltaproteobacteria bacterium]
MAAVPVAKDVFWVGAVDWNVRHFHGHTYSTARGTTYNAYLIRGGKTALVDTVLAPFGDEMIASIREVIDPARIDYVIANHVETDHSGALPQLLRLCPNAKLLGTRRCGDGLRRNYYGSWDFQAVKSGDKIDLGQGKTLTFLEAPMIHWPDSMFTYCPEEKLLLPNDAFGQHFASSERFADQVDMGALMDEAAKYFANILWPLGPIILKKIEEVQKSGLEIATIAPSHGVIWRSDISAIVNAYVSWSKQETKAKAVIVYETMWQSTALMARLIAEGLAEEGISVKLCDINAADRTDVFKEMLDAKAFIVGSSTHDGSMLPAVAGFLHLLKGFRPKDRIGAAFGSFGWGGGAVREIEEALKAGGLSLPVPSIGAKYVPDEGERRACREFGRSIARSIPGFARV